MIEIQQCLVCGAEKTNFKFVFELSDCWLKVDNIKYKIFQCQNCKIAFLNPRPDDMELVKYYTNEFDKFYNTTDKDLIKKYSFTLQKKYKLLPEKKGKILDIGAQKGEFLEYCKRRGWTVEGIELTNTIPNPYNLPIKYGNFLDINYPENYFDVITLWHVIEYLPHPHLIIEKISKILKLQGLLILAMPNFNSLNLQFMNAEDIPRHLFFFNLDSISFLLNKFGFSIIEYNYHSGVHKNSISGLITFLIKRNILKMDKEELLHLYHNYPKKFENIFFKIIDRSITLPLRLILPYLKKSHNFYIIAAKN